MGCGSQCCRTSSGSGTNRTHVVRTRPSSSAQTPCSAGKSHPSAPRNFGLADGYRRYQRSTTACGDRPSPGPPASQQEWPSPSAAPSKLMTGGATLGTSGPQPSGLQRTTPVTRGPASPQLKTESVGLRRSPPHLRALRRKRSEFEAGGPRACGRRGPSPTVLGPAPPAPHPAGSKRRRAAGRRRPTVSRQPPTRPARIAPRPTPPGEPSELPPTGLSPA
jgi:hypothetical protein